MSKYLHSLNIPQYQLGETQLLSLDQLIGCQMQTLQLHQIQLADHSLSKLQLLGIDQFLLWFFPNLTSRCDSHTEMTVLHLAWAILCATIKYKLDISFDNTFWNTLPLHKELRNPMQWCEEGIFSIWLICQNTFQMKRVHHVICLMPFWSFFHLHNKFYLYANENNTFHLVYLLTA